MPGTYSAGTIFLQVVPVFGDVQSAIKRQAEDIDKSLGDSMERSGQKAGERAGKAIGEGIKKEAAKSGGDAGEQYATAFQKRLETTIQGARKSLQGLDLGTASEKTLEDFRKIQRVLKDLDKQVVRPDFDSDKIVTGLTMVGGMLDKLTAKDHKLEITDTLVTTRKNIKKTSEEADALTRHVRELKFVAAFEPKIAEREMGNFEKKLRATAKRASDHLGDAFDPAARKIAAELKALSETEINIDISEADALRKMDELAVRARELSQTTIRIGAKADLGKAEAELLVFGREVAKLDGRQIDIKTDVQTGAAVAKLGVLQTLLATQGGGDAAANSFRGFNAAILAVVTLLPALIPVLGAVGGGLLALLPILASVGGGLGVLAIGFSGIGGALKALGAQEDAAGKGTASAAKQIKGAATAVKDAKTALADAERNAARAAEDAARAVAQARQDAADSIADALQRQKEAQENYRDSVKDVQDAEKDLAEARKQAAKDFEKTDDKIRQNALDIRQARLDAFDATNNLNAVMADGSSTNYDKEQAKIQYEQAQETLHNLRDEKKDLADEKVKQDKDGIDGADNVKTAQDALTNAIQAQRHATEALGKAAKNVDDARAKGARNIATAIRNQQRAEADGARSIARAQLALQRAQEGYGDAVSSSGSAAATAADNLAIAMGKLSPAGRRFAIFLYGLKKGFGDLRDSIQEALLPSVQAALEKIIGTYGPQFTVFMTTLAGVVGDLFTALADSLAGPAWAQFFATMAQFGPSLLEKFGLTTLRWLEVFASIMTAVAPFSERFAEALLELSTNAANWANSEKGQNSISSFMAYAAKVGPDVLAFFGALARAFGAILKALAPWGDIVLNVVTGILNFIADLDPDTLQIFATAIIGIVIAMQAALGATAAFLAGKAVFATLLGRLVFGVVATAVAVGILAIKFEFVRKILKSVAGFVKDNIDVFMTIAKVISGVILAVKIFNLVMRAISVTMTIFNTIMALNPFVLIAIAIVALVVALVILFKKNKTFHDLVIKVWEKVKEVAVAVFGAVVNAFHWVVDAAKDLYDKLTPFFHAIGAIFVFLWRRVVKPYLGLIVLYWKTVFFAMKRVWKNVLWPVLDLIIHIFIKLWQKVVKPLLGKIVDLWKTVFNAMRRVWKNILKPVFDTFISIVKHLWVDIVKPLLGKIGELFGRMGRGFKNIYDHTIKPVFDKFMDILGGKKGLKSKFETVVGAIGKIWRGLRKIVGTPIKFVINTVVGGLVKGFNKVAKFVGSKEMPVPHVDWKYAKGGVFGQRENSFDRGGVMPGYTPGQDVHHFTSPSGGKLNLSGGESILRPEFTAAVGSGWTHSMNSLARAGGVNAIRKAMGLEKSYFLGGVIPLQGAHSSRHTSGYRSVWAGDLNVGGGYDDYGMPVHAWKSGTVAGLNYVGDRSYGRWVDLQHQGNQYSRYAHLSAFAKGIHKGMLLSAGQTLGYVGDLGNTGNPPTSHLHFEINGGKVSGGTGDGDGGGFHFPKWLLKVAKNPLGYVSNLVKGPINKAKEAFGSSGLVKQILAVPPKLISGVGHKVFDLLPGPIKGTIGKIGGAIGAIGDGIGNVVGGIGGILGRSSGGGEESYARGGVLPYNGTMKYDAGGYLPPGLTSVVNLTGKPEPVFTADQFGNMSRPDGKGGWTYAPTFNQSDLTAKDVMDDLEFTMRKINRSSGKYGDR